MNFAFADLNPSKCKKVTETSTLQNISYSKVAFLNIHSFLEKKTFLSFKGVSAFAIPGMFTVFSNFIVPKQWNF